MIALATRPSYEKTNGQKSFSSRGAHPWNRIESGVKLSLSLF